MASWTKPLLRRHLTRLLIALTLSISSGLTLADSAGLNLTTSGPAIHYTRPNIDYPQPWVQWLGLHQQRLEALSSQQSAGRHLLLSATLELSKYSQQLPLATLTPTLRLIGANIFSHRMVAVAAGGTYRLAKSELKYLPADLLFDAYFSPKLTTFGRANYLWGATLQLNISLPQNNELNIGYRTTKSSLDKEGRKLIAQGLFLGITTLF